MAGAVLANSTFPLVASVATVAVLFRSVIGAFNVVPGFAFTAFQAVCDTKNLLTLTAYHATKRIEQVNGYRNEYNISFLTSYFSGGTLLLLLPLQLEYVHNCLRAKILSHFEQ